MRHRRITNTTCKDCPNKDCFVKKCNRAWIKKLDTAKSQIYYNKGSQIIVEGHPVMGLYFVQSGKVKIISTGINGRQQIVRLTKEGHIIGHRAYGGEVYPIGAVAMEDAIICFIDNTTLYEAFVENPEFTIEIMMFYSQELRKVETRLKYIGQMSVKEKVAEALMFIHDVYGVDEQGCLNAKLMRQDIADLAGTNPEQVVRQLSEFEKDGLLSKSGKNIRLCNIDGMQDVISSYLF